MATPTTPATERPITPAVAVPPAAPIGRLASLRASLANVTAGVRTSLQELANNPLFSLQAHLVSTVNKKFIYTSTAPIRDTSERILALLPTFNNYIDSLIHFTRESQNGIPDGTTATNVSALLPQIQPLLGPVRDALDALLADITQDRRLSSLQQKYSYSDAEIVELRQTRRMLDDPVFTDPINNLANLNAGTLFALQHRLNTAFELTHSRAEGRVAAISRIGKNTLWRNLYYSPAYKPLMEKCFHLIKGLQRNINEQRYATHPAPTLSLIEETSIAIRALLDAYTRDAANAAFDATKLKPLLDLQAHLIRLRLCTAATLPTTIPSAIAADHDKQLLRAFEQSYEFLSFWSSGGSVQRLATTRLAQQPNDYLINAFTRLAHVETSDAVTINDVLAVINALQKICILNEAAPTLFSLPEAIRVPLQHHLADLQILAGTSTGIDGRLPPAGNESAKHLALLIKNLLVEKAYAETGYLAQPHPSLSTTWVGNRLGSALSTITYFPSPEIAVAALAFDSFHAARLHPDIVDTELRRIAGECVTALQAYLKQADEQNILSITERHAIRNIIPAIQNIADTGDRNPSGLLAQDLLAAKKVLDRWKKPVASTFRSQAAVPPDAAPLRPVRAATNAAQSLLDACRDPTRNIIEPSQVALTNLDHLSLVLRTNLLPVSPSETDQLQRQLEAVLTAILPKTGSQPSQSMISRQRIIDALTPLNRSLQEHLLQHTQATVTPTSTLSLFALSRELEEVPCPNEFRALFAQIDQLNRDLSSVPSDARTILQATQHSWSLLQAILQPYHENHQALAARYRIPLDLVERLFTLQAHLFYAIRDSAIGSCDATNENFHFFKKGHLHLSSASPLTSTSFTTQSLGGVLTVLSDWIKCANARENGALLGTLSQMLVGDREEVHNFARSMLPLEFLQRTWFYYLEALAYTDKTAALSAPTALIRTHHHLAAPTSTPSALASEESQTIATLARLPRSVGQMNELDRAHAAQALANYEHRLNEHHLQELATTQTPGGILQVLPWAAKRLGAAIGSDPLHRSLQQVALTTANAIGASLHGTLITPPAALTSVSWNIHCPVEFRELSTILARLQTATSENNADQIRNITRDAHAHLSTLLDLANGRNRDDFANHYQLQTHRDLVTQLYQLGEDLTNAIRSQSTGSLIPNSPNFYLSSVPAHNRSTPHLLPSLINTLQHWQNNPPGQGTLVARTFGLTQPTDRLTAEFLQVRWRHYLEMLSNDEQRALYHSQRTEIARLADLPYLATARAAVLAHFVNIPDEILPDYCNEAARVLGTYDAIFQQRDPIPLQTIGGATGHLLTLAHTTTDRVSSTALDLVRGIATTILPTDSEAINAITARAEQHINNLRQKLLAPLDSAASTTFHRVHGRPTDTPTRLALPAPVAVSIDQLAGTPALTPPLAVVNLPVDNTRDRPAAIGVATPARSNIGLLGNVIETIYNTATGTGGPGVHLSREFRAFLKRLEQLQTAIGERSHQTRKYAQQNWALLKAILQTGENNPQLLSTKYHLPTDFIDQLLDLEASLRRAIQTGPEDLPNTAIATALDNLRRREHAERIREERDLRNMIGRYFVGDMQPVLDFTTTMLPQEFLRTTWYFYFECLGQEERTFYANCCAELQTELATPTSADYPQIDPAKQKLAAILRSLSQSTAPIGPQDRKKAAEAMGDLDFFKQQRALRELEHAQPSGGFAGIAVDTLRQTLRRVGISGVEPILQGITHASNAVVHPVLGSSASTEIAPTIPLGIEFPSEFRQLLITLNYLQNIAAQDDPNVILDVTRRAEAHLKTLLDQAGFPDYATIATRSHIVPSIANLVPKLCHLRNMLEQAHRNHRTSTCDPSSENFYLANAPGHQTAAARGLEGIIRTLEHWRQAADRDGTLIGSGTAAVLGAPRPPIVLSQAFHQSRWKNLIATYATEELRAFYRAELERLSILTDTDPAYTTIRERAITLRRGLPEAPHPLPNGHQDIMANLLGRFYFLEQEKSRVQPQEAGGALASTAAAISGLIHRGANTLEAGILSTLPVGSNLGNAIGRGIHSLAQGLTSAVAHTANRIGDIGRDTIHGGRRQGGGPPPPPPPGPGPGAGASVIDPDPNNPTSRARQVNILGRTASAAYDLATGNGSVMDKIKDLLRHARDYYSQNGLGSTPKWMIQQGAVFLAGQLRSHIAKLNPASDAAAIAKLTLALTALDKTAADGTMDNLGDAINQALEYLGVTGGSAPDSTDPFIHDSLDAIERFRFDVDKVNDNQPVQAMIDHEKAEFVKHTSYFGPLKFLNEVFCGQKSPGLEFYSKMINTAIATGPTTEQAALKEAFMNHLEQAGVGPFKRLFIKIILYPFSLWLCNRVLQKGLDNATTWAKTFIQENHKDKSTKLGDEIVERTSGFFAVFQSALRRIADSSTITGTLEQEIAKELDNQAVNGGFTREQLYAKVASELVDEFIFPWKKDGSEESMQKATFIPAQRLWNHFWKIHPGLAIASLLLLPGWVVLYVGQTAVHWVVSRITKSFFNGKAIEALVSESLSSMRTNGGYTHALNKVLVEQLQEVLVKMQKHFGKLPSDASDSGEPAIDPKNMSLVQKEKLRTLVEELFNILPKLECGSPTALATLLNNKSWLQKGLDGFDEKFIYSKVTESAMELLGLAFQTLLEKGQMERLLYKLMAAANGVYKQDAPVDAAEFQATEDRLAHTLNSILDLAVDNSINETLDFNREHETKTADQFTKKIENISNELLENLEKKFQELNHITSANISRTLEENTHTVSILKDMVDLSQTALQKLLQLRYEIHSSNLKDSKAQLLHMIKALNDKLNAIISALGNMQKPMAQRDFGEQIADTVTNLHTDINALAITFNNASWAEGLNQVVTLREHVALLQNRTPVAQSCAQLAAILAATEKNARIGHSRARDLDIIRNQLQAGVSDGIFDRWYQGLGRTFARTELNAWQQIDQNLHARIRELGCQQELKNKLLDLLRQMQAARADGATRDEKLALWSQELQDYEQALIGDIHISQRTIQTDLYSAEPIFAEMRNFSRVEILGTPAQIQQGLANFRAWIPENIKTPSLAPSWLPGQEFVARGVKHFVGGKIKEKVHQAVNLMRKDYIWRYGVVHHNLALPFVKGK